MSILYINGAEAAQALGVAAEELVAEFNPNSPPKDITNITLLAHTTEDATKIGGKTPRELAADFAQMIPLKNRKNVKNIFLLASEAGLRKHGQPSLAQLFVNEMEELGFNLLNVQAVASPGVPRFGMGIDVLTDARPSRARLQVGTVSAYYYLDQYSYNVDQAIAQSLAKIEASKKLVEEIKANTREKRKEKTQAEGSVREETLKQRRLLSQKKQDPHYKRVYILSALKYKTVMEENYTFQAYQSEPVMSGPVSYALHYLSSIPSKYTEFVDEDIRTLQAHSTWDTTEILKNLKKYDIKRGPESHYYRQVVLPFQAEFVKQDFSVLQPAEPYLPRRARSPLHELGLFSSGAAAVALEENLPSVRQQLEEHKERRLNEWGDFHYNFLGIMAVLYLISDYVSGTDYYNSKRRAVKISAIEKLLNGVREEEHYNIHEWRAMHEGRLGKIVRDIGGFNELIAELNSEPKETLLDQPSGKGESDTLDDLTFFEGPVDLGMSLH